MGYITTFTGKKIDPVNPEPQAIDIKDIAHALSLTCRGNGHVKQFFSVGQHCIMCAREAAARGYSRRVVLGCLLHDASEAYMSDVPRPFKAVLKEYMDAEDKLIDLIYEKFLGSTLNLEEKELVKQVDDGVLYYDMLELFGIEYGECTSELLIQPSYVVRPFDEVEKEYLDIYEEWI